MLCIHNRPWYRNDIQFSQSNHFNHFSHLEDAAHEARQSWLATRWNRFSRTSALNRFSLSLLWNLKVVDHFRYYLIDSESIKQIKVIDKLDRSAFEKGNVFTFMYWSLFLIYISVSPLSHLISLSRWFTLGIESLNPAVCSVNWFHLTYEVHYYEPPS